MFRVIIGKLSEMLGDTEHVCNINLFTADLSIMIYLPEIYNQDFRKISKLISLVGLISHDATSDLNMWLRSAERYRAELRNQPDDLNSYAGKLLDNKLTKIINALDGAIKEIVMEVEY